MSEKKPLLQRILWLPVAATELIFAMLARSSEFFEKSIFGAQSRITEMGEAISDTDSFLGKFFSIVLAPIFWILRLIAAIFLAMFSLFARIPIFQKLFSFLHWLWYPVLATGSFFGILIQTRQRQWMFWSLPLMASAAVLGVVFWQISGFNPRNKLSQKYRKALEEAIANKEFDQARLFQARLQDLNVRLGQNEMEPIQQLAREGQVERAIELAERLAPLKEAGMPEAHFWLAAQYIEGKTKLSPEEAANLAAEHLERLREGLLRLNPKMAELPANVTLLSVYVKIKQNKVIEGLQLLDTIADTYPPATMLRFETKLKLKLQVEMMEDALRLVEFLKREPQLFDTAGEEFFMAWTAALYASREREGLRSVILLWHEKFPENQVALQEWALLQFGEIDTRINRGRREDLDSAVRMLVDTTSKLKPEHQPLVSAWLLKRLPPSANDPNYLELAKRAAKEPLSSTMFELLGTAATLRGDHEEAIDLLQKATSLDPKNHIAWNNIAYIANQYFPNRLESALDAANRAAALAPENTDVLHTRGTILARLKRWEPAIADLQWVIKTNPNQTDAHRNLAEAYRATGQPDLAALHDMLGK